MLSSAFVFTPFIQTASGLSVHARRIWDCGDLSPLQPPGRLVGQAEPLSSGLKGLHSIALGKRRGITKP
jgi:hypothetical protein